MWRRNELNDSHKTLDRGDELISKTFSGLQAKLTRLKQGEPFLLLCTSYFRADNGWKPYRTDCISNSVTFEEWKGLSGQQELFDKPLSGGEAIGG